MARAVDASSCGFDKGNPGTSEVFARTWMQWDGYAGHPDRVEGICQGASFGGNMPVLALNHRPGLHQTPGDQMRHIRGHVAAYENHEIRKIQCRQGLRAP